MAGEIAGPSSASQASPSNAPQAGSTGTGTGPQLGYDFTGMNSYDSGVTGGAIDPGGTGTNASSGVAATQQTAAAIVSGGVAANGTSSVGGEQPDYTPVNATLDWATHNARLDEWSSWIAANDPNHLLDYSQLTANFNAEAQGIITNNAAAAPYLHQADLVFGGGALIAFSPLILAGGEFAAPLVSSGLSSLGYDGLSTTTLQAVGLKGGIAAGITFLGNSATGADNTVGGYFGSIAAGTLIAPGVTNYLGSGLTGLATAGGASGLFANGVGQLVDAPISSFSGGQLLLSGGLGLAGGALAAPVQSIATPTSLLFSKWSPAVEELFYAPATATGAAANVGGQAAINRLNGH